MTIHFRNVDVDPDSDPATWPYEAIVTAIERGTLTDWARLTRAVREDPWGVVARQIEEYLSYEQPYGVGPLLRRAIDRARRDAEAAEKTEVADRIGELVARSGLPLSELAPRLGTSASRLSTYRSGKVVPSAAFMVRLTRLVDRLTAPG